METHNELRTKLREWIISLRPTIFITFNFGYHVSHEVGISSVIRFFNRLQRQVHGRNWHKRDTEDSMIVPGFWEHLDSNPHLHAVVRMSKDEWRWLLNNGTQEWLSLQTRGQLHFEKIEFLKKVINYIMKDFFGPNAQERLFTYKAPLKKPDQKD